MPERTLFRRSGDPRSHCHHGNIRGVSYFRPAWRHRCDNFNTRPILPFVDYDLALFRYIEDISLFCTSDKRDTRIVRRVAVLYLLEICLCSPLGQYQGAGRVTLIHCFGQQNRHSLYCVDRRNHFALSILRVRYWEVILHDPALDIAGLGKIILASLFCLRQNEKRWKSLKQK